MQKTALSLAACLLAFAAGVHAQALWKWRDAAGQLHISDTAPPPGTPAKNIISGPGGGAVPALAPRAEAAPSPTAPAASGDTALDKKKKAIDKEKAEQAEKAKADHDAVVAKNEAIRKDNCARAQANLQALESGQRMSRYNDKGEREIMDDDARAAETKRTQEIVTSNCGPAPAGQ